MANVVGRTYSAQDGEATLLRIVAAVGVAAQAAFVGLWFIWGFIESNYDVTRQDISDFGALDATHPLAYNVILSATGILTVPLAYGLYRVLRPGRLVAGGTLALAIFGAGEFLDGLLREDCSPSGNAACRAAADAGQLSWHHQAHDIETLVTIASIIVAPVLFGFVLRARARWADLSIYSWATAAVTFALVAAYGLMFATNDGSEVNGLLERGAALVGVLWVAMMGLRLWSVAGEASG